MFLYVIVTFNTFMIFNLLMNIFHETVFAYVLETSFLTYCISFLKPTHFCIKNSFTEVKACGNISFEIPNLWDNTFHWLVKGEMRKCIKPRKLH